jgi:hypothetical protein
MCVLNYPSFNYTPGETQYGSIYDLANPCVGVLSTALGGLRNLFVHKFSRPRVQAFTDLTSSTRVCLVDANPIRLQRRDQEYQPWSRLPPSVLKLFH